MKHRSPTSNRWADHYTQKARKENYPARSVYKLQEIQRRFQVIKRGNTVLDLGCSPGSWLVYAAELTGGGGAVTGIDLKPVTIRLAPHVKVLRGDVFDLDEGFKRLLGTNFDVLLSDMAPATTGSRAIDAIRSEQLSRAALALAVEIVKPGGRFVCKIFQGEDFPAYLDAVRTGFNQCKIFKPQSSRKPSREIYVIGLSKIK